jgi:hypothetical protein
MREIDKIADEIVCLPGPSAGGDVLALVTPPVLFESADLLS